SAVRTAEEAAIGLHAMPDDLAATVRTRRRHSVNGALEAVEGVRCPPHHDLERLVVVVATYFTSCHGYHLLPRLPLCLQQSLLSTRRASELAAACVPHRGSGPYRPCEGQRDFVQRLRRPP